ncbi:hypothetical protein [Frigoribacterium sp. CFBP 13707]|uniref:hypothetical protein n=1 Tax=Frigoribacterium sp. CFBP 13707 TaxID=2775313 RepID=UPI00178536D5|nr:hypothetical protein [Frigoribacterium sp. CFBP 13707]MBD8728917.1 hypothetical protein [Frigoribacterium sp. CFBP 13707]
MPSVPVVAEVAAARSLTAHAVTVGCCLVVYALTLRHVFEHLIVPTFGYLGYSYVPGPPAVSVLAIVAAAAVAASLPRRVERPSHAVTWIVFGVAVVPTMLTPHYSGYLDTRTALTLTLVVGALWAAVGWTVRRPLPSTPLVPPLTPGALGVVLGAFSAATYGLMAVTTGLRLRVPSLDSIYDVRDEFRDAMADAGPLGYLLSPQSYVVNPYLVVRGVATRSPWLVAAGALGQVLIFSATGFKMVLFSTPLILVGALVLLRLDRLRAAGFAVAPVAVLVGATAADAAQGGDTWTSVLSRRFLVTPGTLSAAFVEHYSTAPPALLAHSVLGPWTGGHGRLPPSLEVGDQLLPGSGLAANANLVADGFSNFGWAGVVGAVAVLAVYLRFLDRCSAGLPVPVTAVLVVMPSIVLSQTALLTSMLTHGVFAAAVLLAVAPRTGWSPRRAGAPR